MNKIKQITFFILTFLALTTSFQPSLAHPTIPEPFYRLFKGTIPYMCKTTPEPDNLTKAAGIFAYAYYKGSTLFLLGHRPDGTWSDFGGYLHQSENFFQGAIREFHEESSLFFHNQSAAIARQLTPDLQKCLVNPNFVFSQFFAQVSFAPAQALNQNQEYLKQYLKSIGLRNPLEYGLLEADSYKWIPASRLIHELHRSHSSGFLLDKMYINLQAPAAQDILYAIIQEPQVRTIIDKATPVINQPINLYFSSGGLGSKKTIKNNIKIKKNMLTIDVRDLPDPWSHYHGKAENKIRHKHVTALHPVYGPLITEWLIRQPMMPLFFKRTLVRVRTFIRTMSPLYKNLMIKVYCRGGKQRSVVFVKLLYQLCKTWHNVKAHPPFHPNITHNKPQ